MKRKKLISILILTFFGIWFFQYFLSYITGAFKIVVLLIGLGLWFIIFGISLYQIIKLIIEKPKHYERLVFVVVILFLNFLSLAEPMGLVDWEKYEGDNLLVAEREGTANCQSIIKLKKNNRLKYVSRCFGVDFYLGTYQISNDTLHFQLKKKTGYMDKEAFATLLLSEKDTSKYSRVLLYQNYEAKRTLSYFIKEIDMDELLKNK